MTDDSGGLADQWHLAPAEYELVMTKRQTNRLGFAFLLTFFREWGRFPCGEAEIDSQSIHVQGQQLGLPRPSDAEVFLTGRTAERLRAEIREHFGFREATVADADQLTVWLRDHVAGEAGGDIETMVERLEGRCRELAIEPPTPDRMERIARSALRAHEDRFHNNVFDRLSSATRERLDAFQRSRWAKSSSAMPHFCTARIQGSSAISAME